MILGVHVGIRGFIASASLKRVLAGRLVVEGQSIRGFIASASLKQVFIGHRNLLIGMYPRLYRLGLIEASARRASSAWRASSYPRLYRLGLIEAGESAGSAASGAGIRGFIASASLKLPVDSRNFVYGIVSEALSPRPH